MSKEELREELKEIKAGLGIVQRQFDALVREKKGHISQLTNLSWRELNELRARVDSAPRRNEDK
jgi:hypothetical protein